MAPNDLNLVKTEGCPKKGINFSKLGQKKDETIKIGPNYDKMYRKMKIGSKRIFEMGRIFGI